jgi:hypothetical protein
MKKYCEFFSKVWSGIHSNMHTPKKVVQCDTPWKGSLYCAFIEQLFSKKKNQMEFSCQYKHLFIDYVLMVWRWGWKAQSNEPIYVVF